MDLTPPDCNHPDCVVSVHTRSAMGRRGERAVAYEARFWRCDRCGDPDTGTPPLEFLDAQLMRANEDALATVWREKFGDEIPASGRPGRKTDAPLTERVAVLLTPLVVLYRPTGPKELALVAASGYRRWPPRLPEQPIFYPVTNEAYARQIAERWNVKESGSGFVTRFAVKKALLDRYERQVVGAREHEEYWIPAEDLAALNDAIVGVIEVIASFGTKEEFEF